jgi:hypothetical protein
MPKPTKIKGDKFRLPWKGPFKIQKMLNNNIMELSTISNDNIQNININKLKGYHHDNTLIVIMIIIIIVNIKHITKPKNRNEDNIKPKNMPWMITICPGLIPKLENKLIMAYNGLRKKSQIFNQIKNKL